jgi:hypothetical protein
MSIIFSEDLDNLEDKVRAYFDKLSTVEISNVKIKVEPVLQKITIPEYVYVQKDGYILMVDYFLDIEEKFRSEEIEITRHSFMITSNVDSPKNLLDILWESEIEVLEYVDLREIQRLCNDGKIIVQENVEPKRHLSCE